jgi:hypothetical protein
MQTAGQQFRKKNGSALFYGTDFWADANVTLFEVNYKVHHEQGAALRLHAMSNAKIHHTHAHSRSKSDTLVA